MLESLNESKKLLPERVAEQIISLIADRALKAGDKLPNDPGDPPGLRDFCL